MKNQNTTAILNNCAELNLNLDPNIRKKFNFTLADRVIKRLDEFSGECVECATYYKDISDIVADYRARTGSLIKKDAVTFNKKIRQVVNHLQKKHKLVSEGFYAGIFMSTGMAIGASLGISMKNLAVGIAVGIAIGVALGYGLDADAKRKGRLI